MQWMASSNVNAVEGLLLRPRPDAAAYLKTLGHPSILPAQILPLAQYLAAEQNRSLYQTWGMVQIAVSALFFFLLLFGTKLGKLPLALALFLFVIALGERLVITPEMDMVGRAADFATDPSHRVRLAREALGYGYSVAELAKWFLAAGVAGILIWPGSGRSVHSRQQINVIDKTNYRQIDG
jgi:hypothetical protein